MNLCSKCYLDLQQQNQPHQNSFIKPSLSSVSTGASSSAALTFPEISITAVTHVHDVVTVEAAAAVSQPNRCLVCRKRVGLTGFKCRCGTTFCGTHRYPEKHACPFDFKKLGREEIARDNPVVKGEKLEKI
jgi:predicted nucleic acid binding AN1-type Zn finger protein